MADQIIIHNNNNLWLGNIEAAQDRSFLNKNRIKVIFNITTLQYHQYPNIQYYNVPLTDSDSSKSIKQFLSNIDIINNIHDKLLTNNNVLIHCEMGIQRSAAIVAAYLMKYNNMFPDDAINHIISKRTISFKSRVTFLEGLYKIYYT